MPKLDDILETVIHTEKKAHQTAPPAAIDYILRALTQLIGE